MAKVEWESWGRAAFDRAASEKKPLFLDLQARWSSLSRNLEAVYDDGHLSRILSRAFVPLRVDRDLRPDIAARYGQNGAYSVVITVEGEIISTPDFRTPAELAEALLNISTGYKPKGAAKPKEGPVWTGAVGTVSEGKLDPALPGKTLSDLKSGAEEITCIDCLEFLLFAALDMKDSGARTLLIARLTEIAQGPMADLRAGGFARAEEGKRLGFNSRLTRLYWDAYSLSGLDIFREVASKTQAFIMRELYDPAAGAFRNSSHSREIFYTDTNAMAVLALLKSAAFAGGARPLEISKQALAFLTKLYDGTRGMGHAWIGRSAVFGLLADNAWMVLALTESFLVTGSKPHREFADAITKFLFQELWDREKGGFLDRVTVPNDIDALRNPIIIPGDNAVAFESLWRLQELKGNPNYRRWLEWGLKRLASECRGACAHAPFARVQEMFSRGRLDLELVGRLQEGRTKEFLWALQQHYLPRKIVSFVDPDDQDYILAHKLQAKSYPRLFGCIALKRKTDLDDPTKVGQLIESLYE